ncbi:MAG: MBL fold metallo-hydrolase [Chloroflexota bacterium]
MSLAEPRVLPIPCPFGAGGVIYVYYLDGPEPALIDTGVAASPSNVIAPALKAAGLRVEDVRWILSTHGHWDHIGGAAALRELSAPDVKVAIHKDDGELLRKRAAHIQGYAGAGFRFLDDCGAQAGTEAVLFENISGEIAADRELKGGERLSLGPGRAFDVIHTPGHSPGSVTYLLNGHGWAFAGDAVQVCGTSRGRFPLFPDPSAYRASVRRLLDDVRPKRLLLGHSFVDSAGRELESVLDGAQAQAALRDSLEMETRLASAAAASGNEIGLPYFHRAAAALGYPPEDPGSWPGAFAATLGGYLPQGPAE